MEALYPLASSRSTACGASTQYGPRQQATISVRSGSQPIAASSTDDPRLRRIVGGAA